MFWLPYYAGLLWVYEIRLISGPINREMRNLITSLKNHNEQLKGEVARYKRKLKEAHQEITKVTVVGSIDAITQGCGNSSASALELPQSYVKPRPC